MELCKSMASIPMNQIRYRKAIDSDQVLHGEPRAYAAQFPDFPPRFSSTLTPPITIPLSTALHIS